MIHLLSLLLIGSVLAVREEYRPCGNGWTEFNGNCYKYYYNETNQQTFDGVRMQCATWGGDIATGARMDERIFLFNLGARDNSKCTENWSYCPIMGIVEDLYSKWISINSSEAVDPIFFCDGPNKWEGKEHCTLLRKDPTQGMCHHDVACDFIPYGYNDGRAFSAYYCKAPPRPREICKRVKRTMSVLFVVDSSSSIGNRDWQSLVKFLQSGGDFIPSTTRVGFVKFSTNVSSADWISPGWTESQYNKAVPYKYDNGETNTPAGLQEAYRMYRTDRSDHKVVVLMTDGIPFTSEMESKEASLKATQDEVRRLRKQGIRVVILGYGKEFGDSVEDMRDWLEDPLEDFYFFDRMPSDFKRQNMEILMERVCQKFL